MQFSRVLHLPAHCRLYIPAWLTICRSSLCRLSPPASCKLHRVTFCRFGLSALSRRRRYACLNLYLPAFRRLYLRASCRRSLRASIRLFPRAFRRRWSTFPLQLSWGLPQACPQTLRELARGALRKLYTLAFCRLSSSLLQGLVSGLLQAFLLTKIAKFRCEPCAGSMDLQAWSSSLVQASLSCLRQHQLACLPQAISTSSCRRALRAITRLCPGAFRRRCSRFPSQVSH